MECLRVSSINYIIQTQDTNKWHASIDRHPVREVYVNKESVYLCCIYLDLANFKEPVAMHVPFIFSSGHSHCSPTLFPS